jgi:hypothetical protein
VLAGSAVAQSGPWKDGELLLYSAQYPSGAPTLYRVDPESGHGEVFVTDYYAPGFAGSSCFDSFRGGVLANISQPPDPYWWNRLWFFAQDGSKTAIGSLGSQVNVRALCPIGDGRIYFVRHTSSWQGLTNLEYLDASDTPHTVMDASGAVPYQVDVERLIYHAPSNALIGTSSGWWATTDCAPSGDSLYRFQLSPDGTRVLSQTCTSIASSNEELMGLDHMPGGKILLTIASGAFYPDEKLVTVDPVTLAVAPWAKPTYADINGGLWSERLGRAVIMDDKNNTLRSFGAGEWSPGTLIPADFPAGDASSGYGPGQCLWEVDTNGAGCTGFSLSYGTGLAGKGGQVPTLGLVGCPDIGHVFSLNVNAVVGGAGGTLFVGLAPAAAPFKGGTFLVGAVAVQLPIVVGGTPGVAGAGSLSLPALLSSPVLAGIQIYAQAGFSDADAVKGVSLTNGLRFVGE